MAGSVSAICVPILWTANRHFSKLADPGSTSRASRGIDWRSSSGRGIVLIHRGCFDSAPDILRARHSYWHSWFHALRNSICVFANGDKGAEIAAEERAFRVAILTCSRDCTVISCDACSGWSSDLDDHFQIDRSDRLRKSTRSSTCS